MIGLERDESVDRRLPLRHALLRQPQHQVEADVVEAGRTDLAHRLARARAAVRPPEPLQLLVVSDCTPRLTRLTPASRKPRIRSTVTVSGFVSSVTSASAATSNDSRHAAISAAISSGSSSDGVPPPKKIVSAALPSPARRISASSARDVPRLQLGVEQTAIEVAVVADEAQNGMWR